MIFTLGLCMIHFEWSLLAQKRKGKGERGKGEGGYSLCSLEEFLRDGLDSEVREGGQGGEVQGKDCCEACAYPFRL